MKACNKIPTTKRSYNQGSIVYEKERNKYRAAITINGTRYRKRFDTKPAAVDWLSRQRIAAADGNFIAPLNITVGEWTIEFLRTFKKTVLKPRTYERYLQTLAHVAPISDIPIQKLAAAQVQKLYNSLTPNTAKKVHVLLHSAFQQAVDLDMLHKNIIHLVKPPKIVQKEPEIFTRENIRELLQTCLKSKNLVNYYPIFLMAAETGMRRGEILGLRWCDVDLQNGTIHICQQLQQLTSSKIIFETPKTKAGNRKISIPPSIIKTLSALKSKEKSIDIRQEMLCFRSKNNTPVRPEAIERSWKMLFSLCPNIPYRNFHVLRHTHATLLLAAGIPIIEVARRLGHSRVSHTLELYGHAIPNYDQKITEKITQIYG